MEFKNADDAAYAISAIHSHPFDSKHRFSLNRFTDIERFANLDETYVDPEVESDFAAHQVILGAGGVIAENLTDLQAIQDGEWTVNLVPLKIGGCDGSPVRAFASRRTPVRL